MQLDTIMHGDCLSVLRTLPDASVDAIVTDPPAGIAFMGKGWDRDKGGRDAWVAWLAEVMRECRRVIKPGGHALVWALPRTSHWTGTAIEDAGWEVRDCVYHVFGSGFPKSANIGKHLDRMAGAERPIISSRLHKAGDMRGGSYAKGGNYADIVLHETAPATDAARQWDGWGTALKPAVEVWWLCRAPLSEPTVAANVLRWGTGALNVDACRVNPGEHVPGGGTFGGVFGNGKPANHLGHTAGRWPPHLLLSHSLFCTAEVCADGCPVAELGAQSGVSRSIQGRTGGTGGKHGAYSELGRRERDSGYGDTGTAARYFPQFRYVAKASRAERNRGCEGLPYTAPAHFQDDGYDFNGTRNPTRSSPLKGNSHPTVKPLALMRWLITLITPPGGIVLDPFAGSGTTLLAAQQLGMHWLGIEQEQEYVAIARARLGMREEVPA